MRHLRLLMLALFGMAWLIGVMPAFAGERPGCDSCHIRVQSLDKPVKLSGNWLFTRDDSPTNKDIGIDTSQWKLAKAPGPWKPVYGDGRNFRVGWYRGTFEFAPGLHGQEVVFMVNTYMARMRVYVDGQEVYQRPHDINVERYYSIQPVPVRFKITAATHVVTMRVDTPLMTGIYQLPFELHRYDPHDTSLVWHQIYGGEARFIVGFAIFTFGLFFLGVFAKTRYPLYLWAGLAATLILPFFAAPGDHFLRVFEPETMLYLHYTGLSAIFCVTMFVQYLFHRFTPKFNIVSAALYVILCGTIGMLPLFPNLDVFQAARALLLILVLVASTPALLTAGSVIKEKKLGGWTIFIAGCVFIGSGVNDVLLALGKVASIATIVYGIAFFMMAVLLVATRIFANTFMDNKKLVKDLKVMNDNLESLVEERTEQLRIKTQDIQSMLQNMPQGVLTITGHNEIHHEYSAYLETIFETKDIAGKDLMMLFANSSLGTDALSQVESVACACVGEDELNFELNAHLMVTEFDKTMPDGRVKSLSLSWSPIIDDRDVVEKLMVCVRDVTELKRLEQAASEQKRELDIIGEILKISQEKFSDFVDSALKFIDDNRRIIAAPGDKDLDAVNLLFRNMHTIKGNARTYGFFNMTNLVHETEQAYDDLRKNDDALWQPEALLARLDQVKLLVEEYARINDKVLGRKGPGRRGSVEKYLMVERDQIEASLRMLDEVDAEDNLALRAAMSQVRLTLNLIGTERVDEVLAGVIDSLPSLARELDKEPPIVRVHDHNIVVRSQVAPLLKNMFTHLLRNAMDHGLEKAETRVAAGKPAAGNITLDVALERGRLWLKLRDDGRGLAVAGIRARALAHGLLTGDQAEDPMRVAQTIFESGVSTAEAVTEVSGRGVGMDAVKGFIEKEGGQIAIEFLDEAVEADYRAFQLVLSLPEKFGTVADAARPLGALRAPEPVAG